MLRYGSVLKARQLVGVRGAGHGLRRPLLRQERDAQDQARASTSRASSSSRNGLISTLPGCRHERRKTTRFYGKYRGTVINNIDPEQRGRIQAMVPDVPGLDPDRAGRCLRAVAGKQKGVYMVPQIGAGVWIEFEQGDPDYPIWVGGFWGAVAEVPPAGARRRRRFRRDKPS